MPSSVGGASITATTSTPTPSTSLLASQASASRPSQVTNGSFYPYIPRYHLHYRWRAVRCRQGRCCRS